MDEMSILSVGCAYEKYKTGQMYTQISYEGGSWTLAIGMPDITPEEVYNLKMKRAQFAFAVEDDALFFLAQFGGFDWVDAPYEPAYFQQRQEYCSFREGDGLPLTLLILDTSTGVLKAMRYMGLGTKISNALHEVCRDMDARHRPIDVTAHKKKIQNVYQKYPMPSDMLKLVPPELIFKMG